MSMKVRKLLEKSVSSIVRMEEDTVCWSDRLRGELVGLCVQQNFEYYWLNALCPS